MLNDFKIFDYFTVSTSTISRKTEKVRNARSNGISALGGESSILDQTHLTQYNQGSISPT